MRFAVGATVLLLLCGVAFAGPASAAVDDPLATSPGEDLLEQRQRELRQRQLEEGRPGQPPSPETPDAPAVPAAGPCFRIDEIELTGATLLAAEDRLTVLSPYIGSCMDGAAINALLKAINDYYIANGYVTTRAYVTPQDLNDGKLELAVQEGTVSVVQLNDGAPSRALKAALALRTGEVLYLPAIEQTLDQINRLPSQTATMQILPGETAGTSILSIKTESDDLFRVLLAHDNTGGVNDKHRVTLSMDIDDLLGVYDMMGFGFVGGRETNALSWNGSVPAGFWSWNASWSYSEYLTPLGEEIDLYGYSLTSSLGGEYLFYRDSRRKLRVKTDVSRRSSGRFVNDTALTPQKSTVGKLALQGDFYPQGWILGGDAGYTRGLKAFGAMRDPEDIQKSEPHYDFEKLTFGFSAYTSFGEQGDWTYRAALQGQYSFDALYGSEMISIGDRNTVRGFEEDSAAGDSGIYLRNDLSMRWPGTGGKGQVTLGVDGGYVRTIADREGKLKCGVSLGASYGGELLTLSAVYAEPACGSNPNDNGAVYLNLSLKLL